MSESGRITVLHYVGYDTDRGGIVSVVRALAETGQFHCVLGVNPGFAQRRSPPLPTLELPRIAGEALNAATLVRAWIVARRVRTWLASDPARVFHAHSRAGLAVALWLHALGERRVVASVHCYGRQRWFYRWASRRLGGRLFWLSPAMKRYYDVGDESWDQCIPGGVSLGHAAARPRSESSVDVVQLGGVGALVPWKQWHLVLEALAAVPADVREKLRFSHIGGVDESEESRRYAETLQTRTAALGLNQIVEWRGEQPSATSFLDEIDTLVIAARSEPFSIAMLESLAAGVPVLAADSGGARDVIEPSRNGWLFRSGDVSDLARALAALAGDDLAKATRAKPGSDWRFAASAVARHWAQVYARISGVN